MITITNLLRTLVNMWPFLLRKELICNIEDRQILSANREKKVERTLNEVPCESVSAFSVCEGFVYLKLLPSIKTSPYKFFLRSIHITAQIQWKLSCFHLLWSEMQNVRWKFLFINHFKLYFASNLKFKRWITLHCFRLNERWKLERKNNAI